MRAILALLMISFFSVAFGDSDQVPLEVLRVQKYRNPIINKDQLPIQIQQSYSPTESIPYRNAYTFYPGSLKENITHLAKQSGWPVVVWQPTFDYKWVGETRFPAENLKEILNDVLRDYPLQAVFYEGNHVLVISPRNVS